MYQPFASLGDEGVSVIVVVGGIVTSRIAGSETSAINSPPPVVGDPPTGSKIDASVAAPLSPA